MDDLSTWWHDYKLLSDVITGLIASAIFLLLLYFLKPRMKICDKIAFTFHKGAPVGERGLYSFKVVNRSLFFKIYDLQISAWIAKVEPSINGEDVSYLPIKLRKSSQWVVKRLYIGHLFQTMFTKDKRLEKRTDYASQFSTYDDLRQKIREGHFVTVEIIAKHSLTGFTRVISKKYKHENDIIKGSFYSGNCCDIKT